MQYKFTKQIEEIIEVEVKFPFYRKVTEGNYTYYCKVFSKDRCTHIATPNYASVPEATLPAYIITEEIGLPELVVTQDNYNKALGLEQYKSSNAEFNSVHKNLCDYLKSLIFTIRE